MTAFASEKIFPETLIRQDRACRKMGTKGAVTCRG
ncbi:hypothetical protein ACFW04_002524 [Cataglyphis niger]